MTFVTSWEPFRFSGFGTGEPSVQPPIGYQPFDNVPVGGGICPTGTRCVGPSIDFWGLQLCAGTCAPYTQDLPTQQPQGTCTEQLRAACAAGFSANGEAARALCGSCGFSTTTTPGTGGTQQPQANGSCTVCAPHCQLSNGRKGKLNKSKYYRFGDCRRGTQPGVVAPGTVCTTPRRTNFGNIQAANRAARRLDGAIRHLRKLEKTAARFARPRRRRSS